MSSAQPGAAPPGEGGLDPSAGHNPADAGTGPGAEVTVRRRRRLAPRIWTMLVSGGAAVVLCGVMFALPVPYVLETPGPAIDTLGSQDGVELVQVDQARSHPSEGQLLLTTVGAFGSDPGSLSLLQMVRGYFDPTNSLVPHDLMFPRGQTSEQRSQETADQMVSSQEKSTLAALEYLGYEVLPVVKDLRDSAAKGLLEPEDTITSINGRDLKAYGDLIARLDELEPGDEVTIGYNRGEQAGEVSFKTVDIGGQARLGIAVGFAAPVEVEFGLTDVGGPSAGSMFALAIIDKLGEEDLTGGQIIAGTGTIEPDGTIGQIGGVRQKMVGADRAGAVAFLVPISNCVDVAGHSPPGLQIIAVENLDQAVASLLALRDGKGDSLPSCAGVSAP
ncbi:MAG: PDZ domain-containing protein [Micrococcales bacterium]|nr:PDZ domain-containing protein [Micrococcales bacterium]